MPPKKFVGTIRRFAKPPTDVTYFNGWCYLVTHEISLACENEMLYPSVMHFSAAARNPIGWRPSVCLSVCLSVTVVDCDLIYWNFSEVIT